MASVGSFAFCNRFRRAAADHFAAAVAALEGEAPAQALVYGEPGCEMQAQKLAGSLANQGILCEASVFESLEETLRYAQAAGIPKVLRVGAETEEILLSEGGKA